MGADAEPGHHPGARQRRDDRLDVGVDNRLTHGIECGTSSSSREGSHRRLATEHPLRAAIASTVEIAVADVADGVPLVEEQRLRDGPSVVLLTDQVLDGEDDVVEELLAEVTRESGRRTRLLDRDTWDALERHRDHRQPAMLGRVPVGTAEAEPEVGLMGAAAPHLRPVQDVGVAVACQSRRRPGHVRAALRLGEQLHPERVPAQQRRQEPQLRVLRAVVEDRGTEHPDRDPVAGRNLPVLCGRLVEERLLMFERQTGTAVCTWKRDPGEPVVEQQTLQVAGVDVLVVPTGQVALDPTCRTSTEGLDRLGFLRAHAVSSVIDKRLSRWCLCSSGVPNTARSTTARRL